MAGWQSSSDTGGKYHHQLKGGLSPPGQSAHLLFFSSHLSWMAEMSLSLPVCEPRLANVVMQASQTGSDITILKFDPGFLHRFNTRKPSISYRPKGRFYIDGENANSVTQQVVISG